MSSLNPPVPDLLDSSHSEDPRDSELTPYPIPNSTFPTLRNPPKIPFYSDEKPAQARTINLGLDHKGKPIPEGKLGSLLRPLSERERKYQAKQIRARARRKQSIAEEELALLYKPIEEWDNEELARGRPRDKKGGWTTKSPVYVNRAVHEAAVRRFEVIVRQEMNMCTIDALSVVRKILVDEAVDWKGKPRTSPSVKLQAAQFLIEHIIGKPKQRIEGDISIKMQQMLGAVLVMPSPDALDYDPNPPLQLAASHTPQNALNVGSTIADPDPADYEPIDFNQPPVPRNLTPTLTDDDGYDDD